MNSLFLSLENKILYGKITKAGNLSMATVDVTEDFFNVLFNYGFMTNNQTIKMTNPYGDSVTLVYTKGDTEVVEDDPLP